MSAIGGVIALEFIWLHAPRAFVTIFCTSILREAACDVRGDVAILNG